jgi:flavin-dependent dehydrogenase
MSIGVVMDLAGFKALKKRPEEMLDEMLEGQPEIANQMERAERVSEIRAESDNSYRNRQLAGERWLLAGDAAGFIDPIFSTGVFVAIESAERAANAIDTALEAPRRRAGLFRAYEKEMYRVMDLYLRFVTNWYKPRFIEVITHPVDRFQLVAVINSMLAGNIGKSFTLWSRMEALYLVTYLQRYLPLCPRLSLAPRHPRKESAEQKRPLETV